MKTAINTIASGLLPFAVVGPLCGCCTNTNSCVYGNSFDISSSSTANTANHASTAPANQVKFGATSGTNACHLGQRTCDP